MQQWRVFGILLSIGLDPTAPSLTLCFLPTSCGNFISVMRFVISGGLTVNPSSLTQTVIATGQNRLHGTVTSTSSWGRRAARRARHSLLPDPTAPFPLPRSSSRAAAGRVAGRRVYLSADALVLAGSAMLVLIAVALLAFRVVYDDRIYPAIVVGDVPVGGLTLPEAEDRLAQRAAALEDGVIVFAYGDRTWTPRLRDLGASVNLSDALADARALGRSGAASRLVFTGAILRADQRLPLPIEIDSAALAAWFDAVDREIGHPAIDARLVIDGTQVSIVPDSPGTVVDRDAATRLIRTALTDLQPTVLALPTHVQAPTLTQADLLEGQATVARILAQPVVVTAGDQQWTVEPDVISPHLMIETNIEQDPPAIEIAVNTERLAATLRTAYADQVNRAPVDAMIGWEGKAVVREPGRNGATLDAAAFADRVAGSFLAGHRSVEVPVVVTEPRVTGNDLESLGLTTLLGEGDSNFSDGVEGRDENVQKATEYMNGTLVPPGGIFSFNDAIGEITAERGFVESLVVQEGVGRDVGGGVCQVSTTIFRAALNAGMPITEWYPHTFRLPNYELDGWGPGFDASILQYGPDPAAWPDFEFENYTGSWLLIEASIAYPHVYVNIYGTGDGRTVTIDAIELGGNAFGFSQVIHDAKGRVITERRFDSYYV